LQDRSLDNRDRVSLAQKLQHANEVAHTGGSAMLPLQVGTQLREDRRQTPVAEDIGVIQRPRLALENFQVMVRIEVMLVAAVQARMAGHDLVAGHDHDLVDVALDRHGAKGVTARHAIVVAVEAHGLILVHLRRLRDARVERVRRQRQGPVAIAVEALTDGLGLPGLDTATLGLATAQQVRVQPRQVLDRGHRRGPVPLQVPHAALDARLLLRPADHAEQRCETIMTRQGLITLVRPTRAALQDCRRHGGRIVPPKLPRHAAKEGERLDEAVKDRLGALTRQRDGEGTVGVGPSHQEHRHLPAPVGEVHVDVAEVALGPLAGIVVKWDERLDRALLMPANVKPNPFLTARVAVLVA
jgi:hypothetical protein